MRGEDDIRETPIRPSEMATNAIQLPTDLAQPGPALSEAHAIGAASILPAPISQVRHTLLILRIPGGDDVNREDFLFRQPPPTRRTLCRHLVVVARIAPISL